MKRFACAVLLSFSACSAPPPLEIGARASGVIIGDNDLVVVGSGGSNLPDHYRPVIDAIGIWKNATGSCTATHLGNGLAITAAHCWVGDNNSPRKEIASCSDVTVEWGYRQSEAAYLKTGCTKVLAVEKDKDKGIDYAIFKVDGLPKAKVGYNTGVRPVAGRKLTVFSHPKGRPEEWSKTCEVGEIEKSQFTHKCDTEAGSSGATVLADDDLRVVGIHFAGASDDNNVPVYNVATFLADTPLGEFVDDFDLQLSPASVTVKAGESATFQVKVTVKGMGKGESVKLSVTGLPMGVTGMFSPDTVMTGGMSTLTIMTAATSTGDLKFQVRGEGGSVHTADGTVTVGMGTGGGSDMASSSPADLAMGGGAVDMATGPPTPGPMADMVSQGPGADMRRPVKITPEGCSLGGGAAPAPLALFLLVGALVVRRRRA